VEGAWFGAYESRGVNLANIIIHFILVVLAFQILVGCNAFTNPPKVRDPNSLYCAQQVAERSETPVRPTTAPDLNEEMRGANIIFILTDDMDAQSLAYMPNVQELLVEEGVVFENYIVNVSLCCPSRATTLTGMYSHNSKILTNNRPNGGYATFKRLGYERNNVATALHVAGYRTALIGKYLNGYPIGNWVTHIPIGWTEWYSPVEGDPFFAYNYELNENGEIVAYGTEPDDYLTDVLASFAVDFVERSAKNDQPFFIYLAPYAPHGPAVPAPRHVKMFHEEIYPKTPSFNEEDVSDKPDHIQELGHVNPGTIQWIDAFYRNQLQSLQAVDEMVARLVETLERADQLDNTYIFYTSDHGIHMGQHRLPVGKKSPYEEDVRVPLVIRGPGVPKGTTITPLAGNTDLAPTFVDIAGLTPPSHVDGRSLLPLLAGNDGGWRDAYLIEHWDRNTQLESSEVKFAGLNWLAEPSSGLLEPPEIIEWEEAQDFTIPEFKGLRTRDYTYVEYVTGERELYNLRADPFQLENLASGADIQFLEQFSEWLACVSLCSGESCWITEQVPPGMEMP
jgi:arylsulfatase A-like enzyme